MDKRRQTPSRIPSEEFSVELGDVNGIKLYDFPLREIKKKTTDKREKIAGE